MTMLAEIDAVASDQPLVGSDMIGRTYNVKTGKVASTVSLLPNQLFDTDGAGTKPVYIYNTEYQMPAGLVCSPMNESTVNTAYSETHTSTQTENNFGIELGISGVSGTFSGELDASYAQQTSRFVSSSYFTSALRSQIRSYRLEIAPNSYRALLKPEVATDIDTMDAAQLVAKYGTHFLRSAIFGGTWDFTQSISTAVASSKDAAQAKVSANYKGVSTSLTHSTQTINMQSSTQTDAVFQAIGGDSNSINGDVNAWAATVPGNFAMISFDANRESFASLQPLSVLATSLARKDQIDAAIKANLSQQFSLYDVVWDNTKIEYWACDYHGARTKTDRLAQGEKTVEIKNNLNQIIIGIGMSIQDNNVSQLGIKVLDLSTSMVSWIDANSRAIAGEAGTYEKIIDLANLAPNQNGRLNELYVAVGASGSATKNECSGLGLFYQTLSMTSASTKYLTGSIQRDYEGGTEVAFRPADGAQTILLGVSARAQDDILKNLWIKAAPLKSVSL